MTGRIAGDRIRISALYRGVTGIERYCREECNRSGPASVWRVYAYLWSHQDHVDGSERTIQRGTGLNTIDVADAIYTLWERGVLDLED